MPHTFSFSKNLIIPLPRTNTRENRIILLPIALPAGIMSYHGQGRVIMNKRQKSILWIGVFLIVLMVFFPPVFSHIVSLGDTDERATCSYVGYVFIFNLYPNSFFLINYVMLICQGIFIALIIGGLIMTDQNDKKCRKGSERTRNERRSEQDRRRKSLPVDNDHRKSQRRSGEDRRQKS